MIDRLAAASGRDVSRETYGQLERYVAFLLAENGRQNLIAPSSVDEVWERHIVDSAQLLPLGNPGTWCDIGSGPGLPGIVIAILDDAPISLVEPRRLRADFLQAVAAELNLHNVRVQPVKSERAVGKFDNITGRAVTSLDRFFAITRHLADEGTRWVLPKGEKAKSELDEVRGNWQGGFKLVESQTRPEAAIIVAEAVKPRGRA